MLTITIEQRPALRLRGPWHVVLIATVGPAGSGPAWRLIRWQNRKTDWLTEQLSDARRWRTRSGAEAYVRRSGLRDCLYKIIRVEDLP